MAEAQEASSTQLLTDSKQDQAAGVASTPTIYKGQFEASEQPPKGSGHLLKPEGAKVCCSSDGKIELLLCAAENDFLCLQAKPSLTVKNSPTIQKMQLSQKHAGSVLQKQPVKYSDTVSMGSVLQSLAGSGSSKKQPLKFGDTITLMNVYNNYMVVSANGRTFTGGYIGQNDRIRIVSPKGKSGQVWPLSSSPSRVSR